MEDVETIGEGTEVERTFRLIIRCIDKVLQGDTVHNASEMGEDEVRGFVDEMTQDQFRRLFSFLETMPRMERKVEFVCGECNEKNEQVLKGIANFF